MIKKVTQSIVLLFFCVSVLSAQELKLAGIQYANYSKAELENKADGYESSFQEFATFLNYPKVLKNKKTILVNGISYGFVQSKLFNSSLDLERTQTFHQIKYTFNVIHRWNEDWLMMTQLSPTLASDFNKPLNSEDFRMLGLLLVSKKTSDNKRLGGGLVYTTRLGKPLLVPLFQYKLDNAKHHFQLFLPAMITYAYTVDSKKRLDVGVKLGVNGAYFNTANDKYSDVEVDKLNYVRLNFGPEISYRLTNMLKLEAYGGMCLKRMYRFEDRQGDTYNYNSKSSPFFGVGLVVVPPAKKRD